MNIIQKPQWIKNSLLRQIEQRSSATSMYSLMLDLNMISTVRAAIQSYRTFYSTNKQVTKHLFDELNHLGELNEHKKNKLKFYVGQGLLVQLWYQTLKKPTKKVNPQAIARFSAWTPFYDDLMDELGWSHQAIRDSLNKPSENDQAHFHYLFHQSMKQLSNQAQVLHFFEKVGQAQNKSLHQKDNDLSIEELINLTREKGGWATCFYASANGELQRPEINLFYEIGACLQLCNDLFDVYKDHQVGIKTLPITDVDLTSKLYETWILSSKQKLQELKISPQAKSKFWKQVMLIISRGEIALNLLLKLKDSNTNKLNLNNLSP